MTSSGVFKNLHVFGFALVLEVIRNVLEKVNVGAAGLVLLVFVDFGGNLVGVCVREHFFSL